MKKIRVLVVDDSALVRKIITDALESDPEIEVVGSANNGKTAVFKNQTLDPDVITMDIEMPIMNGLDALRLIMDTKPKPVIMMSVLTQHGAEETFKALEFGALDFVPKPSTMLSMTVEEISQMLISRVKSAMHSKIKMPEPRKDVNLAGLISSGNVKKSYAAPEIVKPLEVKISGPSDRIIGIGTSTGGPSALLTVFRSFPVNFPAPVLVVQHMPEGFTKAFAERLNSSSTLNVKEAEDGDEVLPGHGYIAPGHSHMVIAKRSGKPYIRVYQAEKVSGHRPSIDVLFNSLAEHYSKELVAAIMTGMGRDGADGIRKIRERGGYTIAQNEETSVVYGMNRVAVEIGGVIDEVPLVEIPKKIVEHL